MVIEGDNAVKLGQNMVDTAMTTSDSESDDGDIALKNVIHCSNQVEAAKEEISIFFNPEELASKAK